MSESSFRGVPFKTESVSIQGGRGGPTHEFIGTGDVFPEDTGGLPDRFTFNGHVIGDDVQSLIDDLKAALDEEGPGELIHPYGAPIEAKIDGAYTIDRNVTEGGMARISIPFVKSGDPLAPTLDLDTGFDLDTKVDFALSLIDAEGLDVTGPDFLQTAAFVVLVGSTRLTGKLQLANAKIASTLGIITDLSSAIDEFTANLNALLRTPSALALELKRLANSLFAAFSATDTVSRGDTTRNIRRTALALAETQALTTNDVPAVSTTTATRQREQDNQDILLDASEIANLCEGVRALGRIPLDNRDQADKMVEDVLALIDGIIERGSLSDGMDQALRDIRASFVIHIRALTVDLTGLGDYTPPTSAPALTIAWDLYGDANREQEIIDRNAIEDPGHIHGGVVIQVADE